MKKKNTIVKQKQKRSLHQKKEWLAGYLFIAPVTIGLTIFYILPFIQNIWFSFHEVNRFNMTTFIGLQNYKDLFQDKELIGAFLNTLKYTVITVPISLFLSIFLASLLNVDIRGKSIYRTIYFLPSVTMPVAIALVWKWIFHGDYGILNNFLKIFGIEGRSWLTDPKTALYVVMIVAIWSSIGYNMIILLAGMQGISKSYYEAATLDGAGAITQFFKVTIPLLSPTIFFVMITGFIGAFQVFDTLYMMIGKDNPAMPQSQTLNVLFYRNAFEYGYKGYAAAISIFMFAIIMLITIIQLYGQKKWVHYD